MEQTWLNPDFAAGQLIGIAALILGSLIVLPAVFGLIIYALLALVDRLKQARHTRSHDDTNTDVKE